MTVDAKDIAKLRGYWQANRVEWDEDRAAHIHGSVPGLLDELDRRFALIIHYAAELGDVRRELERLRQFRDAMVGYDDAWREIATSRLHGPDYGAVVDRGLVALKARDVALDMERAARPATENGVMVTPLKEG